MLGIECVMDYVVYELGMDLIEVWCVNFYDDVG